MKKLSVFALLFVAINCFAQDKPNELNCYNKWAARFEDRGAEDIKDGIYEDVIITNRQGNKATCNNGKAQVVKGKIISFSILLDDGTYEEVKRTWKDKSRDNVNVINGISKTMISVHNELINVLWINKVKPKKAKPTKAPEPVDD